MLSAGQKSAETQDFRKACMLNMRSCQLNLGHYDSCAMECSEVLATESNDCKALYRPGQAYHGLKRFKRSFAHGCSGAVQ